MESFKACLVKLALGISFVLGTNIMFVEGVLTFLIGCALYFVGYVLMDIYRRMD